MDVPAFLVDRVAAPGTVGWLIGTDWPRYQRLLHPSWRPGAPEEPLTWRKVASERGVTVDPGRARWFDVSGQRPNRPDSAYEYPQEGPHASVLPVVVSALLGAFPAAELAVAEWTGYGDVSPGRAVAGAELVGERTLGGEGFTVWRTGRGVPAGGVDPANGVRANYVWSLGGEFVVAADDDLVSTYVGSLAAPIRWASTLERSETSADAPLG